MACFLDGEPPAGICGKALNAKKEPLGNHTARLRSVDGKLVSEMTTKADGTFEFATSPQQYVVEIVDGAGNIVGTATVTVTAGSVTTLTVTATAATIAAAGGASGLAALISGTSGIVLGTAVAVTAITVIVATNDEDSPSR